VGKGRRRRGGGEGRADMHLKLATRNGARVC
jgi:hypothetical protein